MAVAVMCSGGDAAGMNPGVKAVTEYAKKHSMESYLIYDGLEGLIDDNIKLAEPHLLSGIVHRGGAIIRSSRSKRFFEYDYRKKAYENLQKRGIDKMIVFGGDGSFRAMKRFYDDFGVSFVGIPTTIDNDIFGTDYCLGVDTALNVIRGAVDDIRDTAMSFRRAFVVEVMGRDCGYLALVTAMTSGAEMVIIPELPYDLDMLKARFTREIASGRNYIICIVAEGVKVTEKLVQWFNEEIHMESRATILGHIQRGGSPTVYDRLMAYEFVKYGMDKLIKEPNTNSVIVYKDSKFDFVSIDYINSAKYQIPVDMLLLADELNR